MVTNLLTPHLCYPRVSYQGKTSPIFEHAYVLIDTRGLVLHPVDKEALLFPQGALQGALITMHSLGALQSVMRKAAFS